MGDQNWEYYKIGKLKLYERNAWKKIEIKEKRPNIKNCINESVSVKKSVAHMKDN